MNWKKTATLLALSLLVARSASAEEPNAEDGPASPANAGSMVHGLVLGGASTSTLLGVNSAAGHAGLGIVIGRTGLLRFGVVADADIGSTFGGLAMKELTLSAPVLFVFGSLRLGLGPELAYVTISRAPTSTLPSIDALGIGLMGLASVDLYRFGQDEALFVALRPQAALLQSASEPLKVTHEGSLLTAALLLGLRF